MKASLSVSLSPPLPSVAQHPNIDIFFVLQTDNLKQCERFWKRVAHWSPCFNGCLPITLKSLLYSNNIIRLPLPIQMLYPSSSGLWLPFICREYRLSVCCWPQLLSTSVYCGGCEALGKEADVSLWVSEAHTSNSDTELTCWTFLSISVVVFAVSLC